jgi:hypothetical protein
MLDPVVLLHARGVGQHHRIFQRRQPIDQPIPVVGRFDGHLFQALLEWCQKLYDLFELARYFAARYPFAIHVHDTDHNVVAVQIHSSYYFLHRSPFGLIVCCSLYFSSERQLFYREVADLQRPTPLMSISP